ncbi:hypothetical protein [Dickeya dadantii]|uniref:hypothetical protein n=1 Tax=Dickeya dadantii TaxID=204038 RepID=UPI0002DA5BE7|nr:hypothetical protein [Dickeya dadantii]
MQAVSEGDLAASVNINGLARYVLAVQGGMALQARDGASRAELENVARYAMPGWGAWA